MSIGELIVPLIWMLGLIGLAAFLSIRKGDSIGFEYIFPVAAGLGLIIFFFGLLDLWHRSLFIVLTALLAATFIWAALKFALLAKAARFIITRPFFSIIFGLGVAWFGLASLSFPVTADALYFHLGLPKIYAQAGSLFFAPDILFSAGPRAMEMISTAFYFLGIERGSQLFIVLLAAMLIVTVYKRASELEGHGPYAVLILLSVPIFVSQLAASKNDFLLWGLSFFAALEFIKHQTSGSICHLLWSAAGVGLAAGTKSIGLGLFVPFAMIFIYEIAYGRARLMHFAFFLLISLLLALPWYLYSWIVTGNPVFPFFDSIFRSWHTTPLLEHFNSSLDIDPIRRNIVNLIISPFKLIFFPDEFDGRLGYALVLFPLLLIVIGRIPRSIKTVCGLSVIFFLFWYLAFPFARFLLPVGALLAIAGSFFMFTAVRGPGYVGVLALSSLLVAVALPIPGIIRDTAPRAISVVMNTPKYEFLRDFQALDPYRPASNEKSSALPYINAWQYINEHTPPDSKIAILTSFQTRADGYYLEREFVYINPSEQVRFDFTRLRDNHAISKAFKAIGVTHIVIDSTVVAQFSSGSDWSRIENFHLFSDGVVSLLSFCNNCGNPPYRDSRFQVFKIL